MAQTKRKRRTKHRGNAAGVVEARGRTGRRPEASERKATGRAARPNRLDNPPTWRGAFNRAAIAVGLFVVVILLVPGFRDKSAALLAVVPFILLIYVPLGYYTDQWMYRRRQRMKAEGKV
jgi:hypothetical protein